MSQISTKVFNDKGVFMENIRINARLLRQNQTVAETVLWNELRSKRFYGYKFRRQHIFGSYIVDFVCIKLKLIIEVDGPEQEHQVEYDLDRTKDLNSLGYKVLRYTNAEVTNNVKSVLAKISTEF